MNFEGLKRLITNARQRTIRWRLERKIPAWKLILLQQFIFTILIIASTSPYKIEINFDELSKALGKQPILPKDFVTVVKALEIRKLDYHQLNSVFNFTIAVGMLLVLGPVSFKGNGREIRHGQVDKTASNMLFIFLAWLTLSINFFLPLANVVASHLSRGLLSFFTAPFSSLATSVLMMLSLPFSLVEKSPIQLGSVQIAEEISKYTNGRISVRLVDLQNIFLLNYNWRLVFHTTVLIVSVTLLHLNPFETEEHDENKAQENPTTLCRKFKGETGIRRRPAAVNEEQIETIKMTPLTQSQKSKVKVRPVNVIKPLNVLFSSSGNVSNKNSKMMNLIQQEESGEITKRVSSLELINRATQTLEVKPLSINKTESPHLSTKYELNFIKPVLKVEVGCQNSDRKESRDKKDSVSIGITCSPTVFHKSQQKCMERIDFSQQTLKSETTDSSQQCESIITKDSSQQSTPLVVCERSVQCELLSQERFLKLQQSALTLYKKTIKNQEQDYVRSTTLSRKSKVENQPKVKVNVSVQVDMMRTPASNGDAIKRNSKPELCLVDDETCKTIEVQTDLLGYVLERILQERESSTIYSKMDLERTVHSVLSLTEPVKRLTESIRFKAIKSQHGVWYVSLRGDVFLTVARDTLKNAQLNADQNIRSEVSSDVLRAMKNYLDNYNKLSDCFEDDEESDDESYINGFRL